jgi:hypothetical protein
MTTVEVLYRIATPPSEAMAAALGQLHDVYGIRQIRLKASKLLIEYDATRLNEPTVAGLVRRSGLEIAREENTVQAEAV